MEDIVKENILADNTIVKYAKENPQWVLKNPNHIDRIRKANENLKQEKEKLKQEKEESAQELFNIASTNYFNIVDYNNYFWNNDFNNFVCYQNNLNIETSGEIKETNEASFKNKTYLIKHIGQRKLQYELNKVDSDDFQEFACEI
ncbi:32571_t:CDS:2 [Gigaspora margarita]|uniref:32571_t:CDS:1 n=1 Tax=Gigaspora margarita TaxID=4874 RepID=A0ABM8VVM3_GIGMA|nr:32571_t:CDS:2 [Gigaspora margarita]